MSSRGLAAAVVAAAACAGAPDREPARGTAASWSPETAPLIYSATRGGQRGIFVQDGTGGTPRPFVAEAGFRNYAEPSPDGSRIAFQVREAGAIEIHVARADGADDRNLTAHPAFDVLPAWSPDGGRIAFMSTRGFELGGDRGPFPGHVYVVAAEGGEPRRLTTEPLTSSLGPQSWSPDGRRLLIGRTTADGGIDLFALDVDSGAETRLTHGPANEYGASFSPDGARIALHVEVGGQSQIALMRADGSDLEVLTEGPGLRYGPRWSPDGEWLLFTARGTAPDDYDLRAVRIRDRQERTIVATPEDEREGRWLPR